MLSSSARAQMLRRLLQAISAVTLAASAGCSDDVVHDVCGIRLKSPGTCFPQDEAGPVIAQDYGWDLDDIVSVDTPGKLSGSGDNCCYTITRSVPNDSSSGEAVPGRPLLLQGEPVVAPVAQERRGWAVSDLSPDCERLSDGERNTLASAWIRVAQLEHASVGSFARFALDLLAHGAPAELIAAAHQAALDEISHARLAFTLASAYAGEPCGPGPLPIGAALPVARDLEELALSTFREGCVNETSAALLAASQLENARDPAVVAALRRIAEDEARHSELAWRTVAWAIGQGGDRIRKAIARAIETLAVPSSTPAEPGDLAAHGRLDEAAAAAVHAAALRDVILPCARALVS